MSLTVDNSYSLHRVFNRRDKLFQRLGSRFVGRRITEGVLDDFVDDLCSLLPPAIPRLAISQSLFELTGEIPTKERMFQACWRLAGNLPTLLEAKPVHPWNSQRSVETVPVQILEVNLTKHLGVLTYSMLFQFLAGSPCPTRVHQYWSRKKTAFMARRRDDSGYGFMFSRGVGNRSKRIAKYPYVDARQLTGMRCLVVVDPAISDEGPNFQELRFTSMLSSHNRELLKKRLRADTGYTCPEGFDRLQLCHTCYIGQDKCSAACHPTTYKVDFCNQCEQQSYFDPQSLSGHCVNCTAELRKRKKQR